MNCAGKQPDANLAPQAEIVRPPCQPRPELMAAPNALPALGDNLSESEAMNAWIDDMTAYQSLRLQTGALQDFIRTACQ